MFPLPPGQVSEYNFKQISQLAKAFLNTGTSPVSVADIGCYKRPIVNWLRKVVDLLEFVGVDPDEDAIRHLTAQGIDCITPEEYEKRLSFDYSFLLEVVEHLSPADYPQFLANIRDHTGKAIFLTTPNFEGWDGDVASNKLRKRGAFTELRYEPDHLRAFRPSSKNPHDHKQLMTVDVLHDSFEVAFDRAEWDWIIYRAWPWKFRDCATGAEFEHHFKLHAAIWRRSQVQPRGEAAK